MFTKSFQPEWVLGMLLVIGVPFGRCCLCLCLIILCADAGARDVPADAVYEGNVHHLRSMSGLFFQITTRRWHEGDHAALLAKEPNKDPETAFLYRHPKEFQETFSVLFKPEDAVCPWRVRWTCEDANEVPFAHLHQRAFYVTTDNNLHTFVQPDWQAVLSRRNRSQKDFFQHLQAGAGIYHRGWWTLDFQSPTYALVAGALLCASADIPYDPLGSMADKFRQVDALYREGEWRGLPAVIITNDGGVDVGSWRSSSIVVGEPDYVFVFCKEEQRTRAGWRLVSSFETKELGEYRGVTYPKRGVIKKSKYAPNENGQVWLGVCEFTVDSVSPIPQDVIDNWVPPLPSEGVWINDYNRGRSVPYSERTRLSYYGSKLDAASKRPMFTVTQVLQMISAVVSVGVLAAVTWRAWARQ